MRGRIVWLYGLALAVCVVCLLSPAPLVAADEQGAHEPGAEYSALWGVGIYLDQELLVAGVMDAMPAAEAGVREGDRITHVDGAPIAGLTVWQVVDLIRGEPGTEVTLTLQRPGQEDPIEVALERQQIGPQMVAVDRETEERLRAERAEAFERMAAEQEVGGARGYVISYDQYGGRHVQVMGEPPGAHPRVTPGLPVAPSPEAVPVQMVVEGDYLYVLRGYMLYRLNKTTLELVGQYDLRTEQEKETMERRHD